jgi:hypothetical protein
MKSDNEETPQFIAVRDAMFPKPTLKERVSDLWQPLKIFLGAVGLASVWWWVVTRLSADVSRWFGVEFRTAVTWCGVALSVAVLAVILKSLSKK